MSAASQSLTMQKNEVFRDDVKLILTSHSIDNVFDYCPRKFEFLSLYDGRPPNDSGFAAMVGTALHEGVQAWLIARAEQQSWEDCQRKGYMALLRFYPWELEAEQRTKARSHQAAMEMLRIIIESNLWHDWELMGTADGGWAVEIPFLIRHTSIGEFVIAATGRRAMLCTQGKIDWVMRHRVTGEIMTWDLKTTITSSDLIRSEYTFSGQQVGYSQVLNAMLGVQPKQLSVHYLVARFGGLDPCEVQDIEFLKGEDEIEDYWLGKIDRLKRMREYAERGWFPRTNGGCNAWNYECSFFNVCKSRDNNFVANWFRDVEATNGQGYNWLVEMEI